MPSRRHGNAQGLWGRQTWEALWAAWAKAGVLNTKELGVTLEPPSTFDGYGTANPDLETVRQIVHIVKAWKLDPHNTLVATAISKLQPVLQKALETPAFIGKLALLAGSVWLATTVGPTSFDYGVPCGTAVQYPLVDKTRVRGKAGRAYASAVESIATEECTVSDNLFNQLHTAWTQPLVRMAVGLPPTPAEQYFFTADVASILTNAWRSFTKVAETMVGVPGTGKAQHELVPMLAEALRMTERVRRGWRATHTHAQLVQTLQREERLLSRASIDVYPGVVLGAVQKARHGKTTVAACVVTSFAKPVNTGGGKTTLAWNAKLLNTVFTGGTVIGNPRQEVLCVRYAPDVGAKPIEFRLLGNDSPRKDSVGRMAFQSPTLPKVPFYHIVGRIQDGKFYNNGLYFYHATDGPCGCGRGRACPTTGK